MPASKRGRRWLNVIVCSGMNPSSVRRPSGALEQRAKDDVPRRGDDEAAAGLRLLVCSSARRTGAEACRQVRRDAQGAVVPADGIRSNVPADWAPDTRPARESATESLAGGSGRRRRKSPSEWRARHGREVAFWACRCRRTSWRKGLIATQGATRTKSRRSWSPCHALSTRRASAR